jgi:hypothetical protein
MSRKVLFESQQGRRRLFSLSQNLEWLWNQSNCLFTDTRGSSSGGKVLGSETDHTPLSYVEIKNVWKYTSTRSELFLKMQVSWDGMLC